ncbi:MAG: hypothetical protein H6Q10_3483 [Acidobacteria bacterium]|nr:hypothetical protein [Acidobacteriota bacterium]
MKTARFDSPDVASFVAARGGVLTISVRTILAG